MNKMSAWIAAAMLVTVLNVGATPPPMPGHIFHDLFIGPGNVLIASHTDGVFRSVDGGKRWLQVLPAKFPSSRLVDGGSLGLFLVSQEHGDDRYRSLDLGQNWSQIDKRATRYRCGSGLIESSDDVGKTWRAFSGLPVAIPLQMIECHGGQIFSGLQTAYLVGWKGEEKILYASEDKGATWKMRQKLNAEILLAPGRFEDLFVDARGVLYANTVIQVAALSDAGETKFERRIFTSADRGATWTRALFGMPEAQKSAYKLLAVKGNTLHFECIFADLRRGLCRSTDGKSLKFLDLSDYYQVIGTKLKTGPGDEIYTVDMYGVKRADGDGKGWKEVGKGGLPDPYTGIVKAVETGDQ